LQRLTPIPVQSGVSSNARILVFRDGLAHADPTLALEQHEVRVADSAPGFRALLGGEPFDVVVLPLETPEAEALCREAGAADGAPSVVLVTPQLDITAATTAIRMGAADIATTGDTGTRLREAIAAVLTKRRLRDELHRLESAEALDELIPQLVGQSRAIKDLRATLTRAADSPMTVLITGETGTGKELVARALHHASPRRDCPFVAISCGAIPANLLEDEFFGHRRGAFTNADRDRDGLFARANGGTLFLDQMSDMPLDLQAKLLRALQERRIRPLGGQSELPFDARVIVATRKDLSHEVAQGRFRQDLFFRLKVIEIKLPPLREMREDLLLLAHHFIRRSVRPDRAVGGLTLAAARAILRYDWPGNVRELEHCIMAAVAVARHERICATDLPEHITKTKESKNHFRVESLREIEEQHIRRILASVGGNKAQAARILGLDRKTLQRKIVAFAANGAPVQGHATARPPVDSQSQ
jgi:DNA-binding NtrC family response regulator